MRSSPVAHDAPLLALRRQLLAAGLPTRSAARGFGEFFAFLAAALGLVALAVVSPWAWLTCVAAVAGAWLWMAAILCGHDAAHGSVCPRRWQDELLARLAFTLVGGMSVSLWKERHGKHHAHPRVHGKDPEIDQPLFAYDRAQHLDQPALLRAFHRVQAPAFWVLGTFGIALEVRLSSLVHLWRARAPSRRWLAEAGWLAAHYALTFALPAALLGGTTVLWIHAVGEPLIGLFLVAMLAPGHLATPDGGAAKEGDALDRQVRVTRNFRAPLGLNRFMNGLGRHVEHHVAPYLSHFDLDAASPIIRRFLEERGHRCEDLTWWSALGEVHRRLRSAWREEAPRRADEVRAP